MGVGSYQYVTRAGDTFDILALEAYSNEFMAGVLMAANPDYAGVLVFDGGISLNIPVIAQESPQTLPPWKR